MVNLAVFGVGIAIVELLFGAWFSPDNLNRLNLIRGRIFNSDVSGLYETPSPIIKYSRDKYGLRGSCGDPSRINLLTVGGSTTDQRYISDGSTWQDVLQNRFAAVGSPVVVGNAGVDGQSTFGHIKNFDWWFPYIPNLKPGYILFYVGLNDFYKDEGSEFDEIDRDTLVTVIKEHSALWHLLRTVKGTYEALLKLKLGHNKVDFAKMQWTREPLQNNYAFMSPRLDAYAQRLRILVARTRGLGSEPIFVTQPSRFFRRTASGVQGLEDVIPTYDGRRVNGVDFYHMMNQFNQVMQTVCNEEHVLFIDLAADPGWDDADFYDYVHMSPKGARKVGICLFEKLENVIAVSGSALVSQEECGDSWRQPYWVFLRSITTLRRHC